MSTTSTEPTRSTGSTTSGESTGPTGAPASTSTSPTLKSVWASSRGVLLVALLVVLGAALPVLLTGPSPSGAYLDPSDTSLDGSAALATLLRERGVDVSHTGSVHQALASAGADTQVLVSRPELLTRRQAGRLAASGADLFVIGADHAQSFLPGTRTRPEGFTASLPPHCNLPAAVRAGSVHLGGVTFDSAGATASAPAATAATTAATTVGCYPIDGRPTLVSGGGVTLVADGAFMTNRRLGEDGNAALALNLAGADSRLTWLVAPATGTAAPAPNGDQSLVDLVPPQVPWAAATLALAVVLTALWRGRRLGPVVVEPLPVVVRAAETVRGRGRLYRARRARQQAARALRTAATARIATRLGFTRVATPVQVTVAVATRIGQDSSEVAQLLYGPAPEDDHALVRLADDLDALERRVRER